ncbi:hypothetical protein FRUB_10327 [Fimbriiglobus ruber]|uniref:Uncharacterized protein n=1 Tax=Fimbriiglobus ruber TaxID=1908690 RepID=A0A225DAN3_9BACT|nr:hypothetical protein FRUB_10327 [Fimbriiglobus ruber]
MTGLCVGAGLAPHNHRVQVPPRNLQRPVRRAHTAQHHLPERAFLVGITSLTAFFASPPAQVVGRERHWTARPQHHFYLPPPLQPEERWDQCVGLGLAADGDAVGHATASQNNHGNDPPTTCGPASTSSFPLAAASVPHRDTRGFHSAPPIVLHVLGDRAEVLAADADLPVADGPVNAVLHGRPSPSCSPCVTPQPPPRVERKKCHSASVVVRSVRGVEVVLVVRALFPHHDQSSPDRPPRCPVYLNLMLALAARHTDSIHGPGLTIPLSFAFQVALLDLALHSHALTPSLALSSLSLADRLER